MRARRTGLAWVAGDIAVILVAAVACGSSTSPSPTVTPVPSPAPEPIAGPTADPAAAAEDEIETARQEYAAAVRAVSERSDARREEIFDPVNNALPGPAGFLPVLAQALPLAIEGAQADIAALEVLAVPEDYSADQARVLSYLGDQIALWRREIDAAEARNELILREASVESDTLLRNFISDLSPSFREFFLASEEARELGELFGGLTDAESAYLDTLNMGFEEFRKRNAVFGQTLSRQFADARAMLEALRGAGAGTAFEAVQQVIAPAEPPPRFKADHELLLRFLDGVVRLDREVGKAVEDGDPVHFVVSNFEFAMLDTSVRAALELSAQVRNIAMPQLAFSFKAPGLDVIDGGYREAVHMMLREFRARFPRTGPDYLGFNLLPDDGYQVVSRAAPGFIAAVEEARARVVALTPPDELREDHHLLTRYFDETLAAQRAVVDAATAEDLSGLRDGINRTLDVFCETARGFSETMKPVVFTQFGGSPPDPDLTRECGPV